VVSPKIGEARKLPKRERDGRKNLNSDSRFSRSRRWAKRAKREWQDTQQHLSICFKIKGFKPLHNPENDTSRK